MRALCKHDILTWMRRCSCLAEEHVYTVWWKKRSKILLYLFCSFPKTDCCCVHKLPASREFWRCNCFGLFSGGSFIYLFDHVWRKPAGDLKFFQVIRIEKNIRVFKIKVSCSPSMARSLRIWGDTRSCLK